ncbi:MAG: flagellar basal body L-ring protein FlgH [Proteobacteria bacterium]|nr:flagellar basal body L-ring protein FlgH [Pseudomonadota bacterium]MBU1687475.1 flagellar basal body L-ring protein FlgH [Pseudomonadota bacterium]
MKNILHQVIVAALSLLLSGCWYSGHDDRGAAADHVPVRSFAMAEAERPLPVVESGAIYQAGTGLDLYGDRRARRVGDLVLVKIVESSSGAKKATTSTGRKSSVSGGITSLFGAMKYLTDKNVRFVPSATNIQAELTNDFEGTGETKRNSTVTATISARVVEKTLDGNLLIRGFREIRVNEETQHIILSGLIRPQDVGDDNSILSSYISDARIEYGGSGVVSEKQRPGWLARSLDVVWPF